MKFDINNIISKIKNIKVPIPKRKPKDGEKDSSSKDRSEPQKDAYSTSMEDLMAGYGDEEEYLDDYNDEGSPHEDDVEDYLSQFENDEDSSDGDIKSVDGYEDIDYDSIGSIEPLDIPDDDHDPLSEFELPSEDDERGEALDDLLSEFTVSEINPLENVTVFSNDDDTESPEVVATVAKERPTPFTMLVFGGIGLVFVLILVLIAIIIGQMLKANAKSKPQEIEIKTVVQGEYLPNNSDFLLTNEMKKIGDDYIILKKILIDTAANVFYFKGDVDTRKYSFILYDSKRRLYDLDLTYLSKDGSVDNTGSDKSVKETIVRFEPFGQAVSGLTLEMTNNETKEKASFSYSVDRNFQFSTVKYLEEPIEVGEISEGVRMHIDSMIFSGAGSVLNYTIEWDRAFNSTVTFDAGSKGIESITMSESRKRLPVLREAPLEYTMNENKLLGRMDFAPVANLNATMYIGFKDLVMNIECDNNIDLMPIHKNKSNSYISIDIGDYVLNIERIAARNDTVVLVYHVVDKRIEVSDKKDYSNRVEATIDSQLYLMTEAGIELPLSGEIFTTQKGSDILYDTSKHTDFLQGAGDISYRLHLKSVEIGVDDFVVPVELSQFATKKSEEILAVENAIVTAFKTRLLYKSGRSLLSSLTGFSEDLVNDAELMANYQTVKLKDQPLSSVQIENITEENGAIVAIVRESWSIPDAVMRNTHKIRLEMIDKFYIITKDEIIY